MTACWAFAGHCQETGLLLENRKPRPSAARVGPGCGPIECVAVDGLSVLEC